MNSALQLTALIMIVSAILYSCPAISSENKANDYLLSLSPTGQAQMLGRVVGEGCKGRKAFYMGSAYLHTPKSGELPIPPEDEYTASWSVKCANGKNYVVGVDPTGKGKVLECAMLEKMHAGKCFKKFPTAK
ncbi:MAG TPA: hypothetical protein VFT64_04330 [Rickettsiales bacterium]|nr:hypothetical protein [Rickettsiales bacterium]